MKHAFLGILVLTGVLGFLVGPALAQTPANPDWKDRFRAHDKNNDGKIDRAEFQEWMSDLFFHMDKDHKGYLVFDDVKDVMSLKKFKAQDKNGDGKITLKEFLNASFQDFAAADVNRSGALNLEEFEAYLMKKGK